MTPGKVLIKFSRFSVERVQTVQLYLPAAIFLLINITISPMKRVRIQGYLMHTMRFLEHNSPLEAELTAFRSMDLSEVGAKVESHS